MTKFIFGLSLVLFPFFVFAQSSSIEALDLENAEAPATRQQLSEIPELEDETSPFMLVRFEPHWAVLTELTADIQFILTPNLSIGPTLGYMANGEGVYYSHRVSERLFFNDRTVRESYGLKASYYFTGVQNHSPFVSLFGKYRKSRVTFQSDSSIFSSESGSGEFSENILGLTAGYQWVWMNFLTFGLGAGIANYDYPSSFELKQSNGTSYRYELGDTYRTSYALDVTLGVQF